MSDKNITKSNKRSLLIYFFFICLAYTIIAFAASSYWRDLHSVFKSFQVSAILVFILGIIFLVVYITTMTNHNDVADEKERIKRNKEEEQKNHLSLQFEHAKKLLESGNYENAISEFIEIKNASDQLKLSKMSRFASDSIEQAQVLQKFIKMLKISNRIKIDDLCEQLNRSRKEILGVLIDWGEKFGIKLDNDVVIVENTDNLDSMISDLLERSFNDWSEKEQTKQGKI